MDDEDDPVVAVLPVRYSNHLEPYVHIHQFPLLTRPLQVPPRAKASGKRISARIKPEARRMELHVPVDTRPEVWNAERGAEFGVARIEDDKEKNQARPVEETDPRLTEVRMRSEEIPQKGVHILGVVRAGELHLHPISQTHQMRPTLTYLDLLSKKSKRGRGYGSDSDSDDGPPPDPDEVQPSVEKKKGKKKAGETREVQVSARRADDVNGVQILGGMSAARREMLMAIHAEEDESWCDMDFFDSTMAEATDDFERMFSQNSDHLQFKTKPTAYITTIHANVS
ncbi:hypothetical protein FISHEDRAFT_49361 [Fistulina hepatica ATCC 64428]|uniref:DNA-directed RNA polymerase III subunit Rpc5 n=1 Tax=Fistulina hepatica ATCC 64428 TaxID=1128425 RepID=A0A0D7A3Q4_9AGAR|nr:hypothetical protein FISHEDRAFT_49361 [Fistulina hepatica ATCC 64428]